MNVEFVKQVLVRYAILTVLSLIDYYYTAQIIDMSKGVEMNPLLVWAISHGQLINILYIKIAALLMLLAVCFFAWRKNDRFLIRAMNGLILAQFAAACMGIYIITRVS